MKESRVKDFDADIQIDIEVKEENRKLSVIYFDCQEFPNLVEYVPTTVLDTYVVGTSHKENNALSYELTWRSDGDGILVFSYKIYIKKEYINSLNINQREYFVRKSIKETVGV